MRTIEFDEAAWPTFPISPATCKSLQIRRLIASKQLAFSPDGVSLITPREPVLKAAKAYIATAEISFRTSVRFNRVPGLMKQHPNIQRHEAGWDRAKFERAS